MATPPEKLAQSLEILRKLQTSRWRSCHPRQGSVAHAPGTPSGQWLSPRGHKRLVYPEPPGRSEGREHGLVCVVLAILRSLSGRAFCGGMVPFARTVPVTACR